ncbi:hypothetical protein GXW82_16085 [Streptacidiphilus sp. 4-A2]|nr:hypothetical protein [Streptacidiphilus sp. 4-A2]
MVGGHPEVVPAEAGDDGDGPRGVRPHTGPGDHVPAPPFVPTAGRTRIPGRRRWR